MLCIIFMTYPNIIYCLFENKFKWAFKKYFVRQLYARLMRIDLSDK